MDGWRLSCSCMLVMAKASKEVILEVYSTYCLFRESSIPSRCKDVTNKLWEEVTPACGMSGQYFQQMQMIVILYSEDRPSEYTCAVTPYCLCSTCTYCSFLQHVLVHYELPPGRHITEEIHINALQARNQGVHCTH